MKNKEVGLRTNRIARRMWSQKLREIRDIQKVFGFYNRVLPMKNKSNQHSINKTKQKQRLTVYLVLVYYTLHIYTIKHLIIKYLLNIYYVAGTLVDAADTCLPSRV